MKTEHTHQFTRSKPSSTVEICSCGKFRFTKNAGPPIVEVSAASVESPRASQTEQTGRRLQLDCAWASGRECHKGAMIGEKATNQQMAVWRSVGLIK